MHELLYALLKYSEEQVRGKLEPLLKSLRKSEELLKVLGKVMIVVDAVETKFYVRLNLLVVLHKFLDS